LDERFDRADSFDHVGRLSDAYTGSEARNYTNTGNSGVPGGSGPYKQNYQYSVWDDMLSRTTRFWSQTDSLTTTYQNGRNQNSSWQYDAAGNLRFNEDFEFKYDAMGRNTSLRSLRVDHTLSQTLDADGEMVRRTQIDSTSMLNDVYYVRSTVLGGKVLTELNHWGQGQKNYVYLGDQVLATQETNNTVWHHENPVTGSRSQSAATGSYWASMEPDPMGVDVGFSDPAIVPPEEPAPEPDIATLYVGPLFPSGNCKVEGIPILCAWAQMMLAHTAVQCPNNDCGARSIFGIDANGRQAPAGWLVPMSNGFWAGNGEADDTGGGGYVFFDDVQYGTAFDVYAMYLQRPERKGRKGKGRRRRTAPLGSIVAGVAGDSPFNHITIEHFSEYRTAQVRAELPRLFNPKCADAFHRYGLKSPSEFVMTSGWVIRPAFDLSGLSGLTLAQLGLEHQETRENYRLKFDQGAEGGTITPFEGSTKLTTDGRVQTYLNNNAFAGPGPTDPFLSYLDDVITHEAMHGGGAGKVPAPWYFFGGLRHDLAGFRGYNEILAACK